MKWLVLAGALVACSDDPPGPPAALPPSRPSFAAHDAALRGRAQPFGAVAELTPAMTPEDVARRVPRLGELRRPAYKVGYRNGHVAELQITGLEISEAALATVWGASVPGLGNWSDHRYYFDRELRWEASTVRLGQTMTVRFVALVQIEELFGAPPELGALRAHGFTVTETADGFFVEPVPTAFGMASVTSRKDRWSGGVRCYAAGQCAAARAWLVARKLDPHTTGDQVSFDVDR